MIKLKGKILFNPDDKTRKHVSQSSWKKMALVMFEGDVAEYYAWFIEKRYNLKLNKPLRGAHISFINDSMNDLAKGLGTDDEKFINEQWDKLAKKWNGKEIEVCLDPDVRMNDKHIWLIIPYSEREILHGIREEVGLSKPFYGLHMSIGYAAHKQIEHSKYIVRLASTFGGEYN